MLENKTNIVVITGAGISAESGLQTFRGNNGLWNGYNIQDVASPQGWKKNPEQVLDFYNKRRRELKKVKPNSAHHALVELEELYKVQIITQNVDNLHEQAGSQHVLHLHGELLKVRSEKTPELILFWEKDLHWGDKGPDHAQLRPHIVWFGEAVPELDQAIAHVREADVLLIIGTSLQVYPAANLMHYAPAQCPIYYIDPHPQQPPLQRIKVIAEKATVGMKQLHTLLMKKPFA